MEFGLRRAHGTEAGSYISTFFIIASYDYFLFKVDLPEPFTPRKTAILRMFLISTSRSTL
jgi:hypothetical protein